MNLSLASIQASKKDLLFYFPNSYENRKILQKNFFRQSYIYIFQVQIQSLAVVGSRIFVNATVFNKRIIIIHTYKLARFFSRGLKTVCGSLKYIEMEDTFQENYDPIKGDKYDNQDLLDIIKFQDEYKYNRGWCNEKTKIYCFFPEIFDLRIGIVAKYSKLKPAAVKKLKSFIINNAPIALKDHLMQIHEPTSVMDLNEAMQKLFITEISCFLKYINKRIYNDPMPINPQINISIELTNSQKFALQEIYNDLSQSSRMSRVLYGDVGSGKTIVAILAALKCISNSKNVLFLAPTLLLAKQIKNSFKKFIPKTNAVLITGEENEKPQEPCVFIGTHALLWRNFKNIGLVIVDEQHKFGVEQRHILTKNNHNLLMMTATIIPRTFQMILLGNLKFSQLEPQKGKPEIKTFVAQSTELENIFKEVIALATHQKIIWITPTIENTEKNYNLTQSEEVNSFLLHGKSKDKDSILKSFDQSGNGILFATTVIEVGIDIDAKCIVIEKAHQFGLAQLHQIRGRVGRRLEEGICILIGDDLEKLYAIQKAKTGFEITKLDVHNRGFGVLQGKVQSGFESFIFAKHWVDKKWRTLALSEEIIAKAKLIKPEKEICDLFFESSCDKIKL